MINDSDTSPDCDAAAGGLQDARQDLFSADSDFPRQVFSDSPVGQMIDEIVRVEKVPYTLPGMACLGAVSAAINKGLQILGLDGRTSRGNLYLIGAKESGGGKTVTCNHAFEPLRRLDQTRNEEWLHTIVPRLQVQIKALGQEQRRLEEQYSKAPTSEIESRLVEVSSQLSKLERMKALEPRLFAEDATEEALGRCLAAANERMAILSADGRSVMKNLLGRYKQRAEAEADLFLKAWSGDPHRTDRITREPVRLDCPSLVMCVMIQPDLVESLVTNQGLAEGGLLPRVLFAEIGARPQKCDLICEPFDEGTRDRYNVLLTTLARSFLLRDGEALTIRMSPEAELVWLDFQHETVDLQDRVLSDMRPFVSRWAEQAIRLALCLHASFWGTYPPAAPLGTSSMRGGVRLMKFFARQQIELMRVEMDKKSNSRFKRLVEVLVEKDDHTETMRNLKSRHRLNEEDVLKVIRDFPQNFQVRKTGTGGRPSHLVTMVKNPYDR